MATGGIDLMVNQIGYLGKKMKIDRVDLQVAFNTYC